MKRCLDVAAAAIGLALLSPILAAIAFTIKREDGGPVFYRGRRVGLNGRTLRMFKFRTMVLNADKMGGPSTADGDPRIMRIGRFLRKHKLDELPQLINVVRGDMSLVGPRPEVPCYVDMLAGDERRILSVKPGITDLASLWNSDEGALLAGSSVPERTYLEEIRPEKIRLQLRYVDQQSFGSDLVIIVRTLRAIVSR